LRGYKTNKMKTYKQNSYKQTCIKRNASTTGEMIETKVARAMKQGEDMGESAPIIYTERSTGVSPAYNIKTDRWEIAIEGIDKIQKSRAARNEENAKVIKLETDKNNDGKAEPTQGTN